MARDWLREDRERVDREHAEMLALLREMETIYAEYMAVATHGPAMERIMGIVQRERALLAKIDGGA